MTTPSDSNNDSPEIREYLEAILQAVRVVDAKVDAVDAKVDAVDAKVDALDSRVVALETKVDADSERTDYLSGRVDALSSQVAENRKLITSMNTRMTELEVKFDGIRNDLAMVKGGHARNAMRHNLSRIADEFGFLFISEMPQQAVIDFAKVAASKGIGAGEAESFRNADVVVHVRDEKGEPGYLAIEASFTIDGNDVRRANRNADCLHEYTGLPAYGAIAGVEVLPDAQADIDAGKVLFYSIRPRELQSE